VDNGQELDGSVQGFGSLVRIFAYGWEECNPKAFSAKGIVMVGEGLSGSVVVSVGCRLWITRALGRICNARAVSTYEFRSGGLGGSHIFLILSHLNKLGFGKEPATAKS
jgi:hypothetical protein